MIEEKLLLESSFLRKYHLDVFTGAIYIGLLAAYPHIVSHNDVISADASGYIKRRIKELVNKGLVEEADAGYRAILP